MRGPVIILALNSITAVINKKSDPEMKCVTRSKNWNAVDITSRLNRFLQQIGYVIIHPAMSHQRATGGNEDGGLTLALC